MRLSKNFWKTYKEVPSDAELISHQLLVRAGLIHKASNGLYSYLPFALRSIHKISNIIREELEKIDCSEIQMSMVTPGSVWKESGRWETMGPEMLRFQDRTKKDMCLSPTNEEAVTAIFKEAINSYKQLPLTLYQIHTKYRDEIRPRFGLLRGREFLMKDAYSFHLDKPCMDEFYQKMYKAYEAIFSRMGLDFTVVEADGGAIAGGDSQTHEFQVLADNGEDTLIVEKSSGYSANIEKATTKRAELERVPSAQLQEVATPGTKSIAAVCEFLNIAQSQSLKSLVYTAVGGQVGETPRHILVLLLGDDELNEVKLKNYLSCQHLNPSNDKVLDEYKLYKGFIGPIGLDEMNGSNKMEILIDESIDLGASYVAGANKPDIHYKGLVISRDVKAESFKHIDLRLAKAGDLGPSGTPVVTTKGIEVGHIFQLGDKYSKSMKATVLNDKGQHINPLMGCYGIGVTRTMQAAIEQCHDAAGIIWPAAIAPYQVYFAMIGKSDETKELASDIYMQMKQAGIEVVFDDRGMGPGSMFKDADLLGLPIRVVLGERDYKNTGELEIKLRKSGETYKVKKDELLGKLQELVTSQNGKQPCN